jgi:acyl-CoA thioester hydrolase
MATAVKPGQHILGVRINNSAMTTHQTRLRVRYAETDQMGVVYYANYLVWMEVARVEYCKAAGFSYEQMEREDGILLAVSEVNCRYLYPARFDQEVTVETSLAGAHPRMVTFAYEIRLAEDGRKLATGETKHVFCGRDLKPARLPEKYRANFGITGSVQRPR